MRRLIVDLFRINIAKLSIAYFPVPICDVEAHSYKLASSVAYLDWRDTYLRKHYNSRFAEARNPVMVTTRSNPVWIALTNTSSTDITNTKPNKWDDCKHKISAWFADQPVATWGLPGLPPCV